jgi:acyl-CoA synthetase (NDP forming)/GNAT superfamily N-acetyltransferase
VIAMQPAETAADGPDRSSYALLTDGGCIQIRAAAPGDWQAVHDFVAALGSESIYRRFFGFPSHPGKLVADAVCAPVGGRTPRPRGALLALLDGEVVGLAEWIRAADPAEAEIAFAVADRLHGHGVATLLAEHLLDDADRAGLHRLTAVTQAENRAMLDVFAMLGVPVRKEYDSATWSLAVDLDLPAAARVELLDAAARRERLADDISLRHLLAPASVAVLGDQDDPAVAALRNHLHDLPGGVALAGPDGADLPQDAEAELAVIMSPPEQAADAVRAAARHGARAVVVTSTGFDESTGRALLDACRAAGVRLLGPGSLGVIDTAGGWTLNASLAPGPFAAGPAGVAVQSGGVGLAILSRLAELGVGVRTFAAVGDKYDVSANDLLMHWESDPDTTLGLLHVESFGNPRKFARTARRLSRRIPLLAVDPERSPSQARTALYAQAGITAVPSLGALVAAAALVAHQPAPRGPRVSVLGNTRGMVSLAVQACVHAGLDVAATVNLTAGADARTLRRAVAEAAKSGVCDAVLVALAPTAPFSPVEGLAHGDTGAELALLAVLTEQSETVTVRPDSAGRPIPCYNDAAVAAEALAAAVAAGAVRERPEDPAPETAGVDPAAARSLVEACLAGSPRGRSLYASERAALLDAFGVRLAHGGGRDEAGAVRLTVTAWQDFVFGPLLTCAREGDAVPGTTLLVPAGTRELAALARHALGAPGAAPHGTAQLAALLARVAVLVEQCPQTAAARLHVLLGEDGSARVTDSDIQIAPAKRTDPYLRRLRRAPFE